jgi:anti-sigma factor RsiW
MTMDLTCREFAQIVDDYLEGALPARERLRCEQHVIVCSGCARYFDQARATIRLTATLAVDELGEARRSKLLAAIAARRSGGK